MHEKKKNDYFNFAKKYFFFYSNSKIQKKNKTKPVFEDPHAVQKLRHKQWYIISHNVKFIKFAFFFSQENLQGLNKMCRNDNDFY